MIGEDKAEKIHRLEKANALLREALNEAADELNNCSNKLDADELASKYRALAKLEVKGE